MKKSYAEKHRKQGKNLKLSIENQLLAALEYWREYPIYAHIAASYGKAESKTVS
ncbi:MAG: transposase family protein [Ruminococcus sp.]|nr:transposase family protein [Ruminococcus sp.]